MVDPGLVSLIELGVLAIGVTIAVFEIRNMSQTRRTEVMLQFFDKFSQPEFEELWRHTSYEQKFDSIEEWGKKYGPLTNPEAYNKWMSMMAVFNATGLLLKKGLVDFEDVYVHIPPFAIITIWEKYKPIIVARRKQYNYPSFWELHEHLYNETRKRHPQVTFKSPYQQ